MQYDIKFDIVLSVRKVIFYQTARGDAPVLEFIQKLDKRTRAKVERFLALLQEKGEHLHRPFVDHLRGSIRELRVKSSSDQIRVLFFFYLRNYVVLAHAIRKKTRAIPASDIDKAIRRMNDFIEQVEKGLIEL